MVWTTQQPFVQNTNLKCVGRILLKDLPTVSGATHLAKKICDIVDGSWRLMVTHEALPEVADFTNIRINKLHNLRATSLTETNKKMQYELTNVVEITALFGVFYMGGALPRNMDTNTVFYHETADPMMSPGIREKETLIYMYNIQNSRLRKEQWSANKFAIFWDFFEHCNK